MLVVIVYSHKKKKREEGIVEFVWEVQRTDRLKRVNEK